MPQTPSPWRPWRESFQTLSLRQVARDLGMKPWRLSLIERGVPPTAEEERRLRAYFTERMQSDGAA